jgi:hypothetical protein
VAPLVTHLALGVGLPCQSRRRITHSLQRRYPSRFGVMSRSHVSGTAHTHTHTHTHTSNVALSQPAFFPSITNSVFDSCTNRVADNLAKCDLYRVAARLLSASPTQSPTTSPTASPTQAPTASPTVSPTLYPTVSSTSGLTQSLSRFPTTSPTTSPHRPTSSPSGSPSTSPSQSPTTLPTASPTVKTRAPISCIGRQRSRRQESPESNKSDAGNDQLTKTASCNIHFITSVTT